MTGKITITAPDDLSGLSPLELISLWRRYLGDKVPDHLPRSILTRLFTYRLQVEQHGGLSKKAIAYLKVIERDLREGGSPVTPYPEEQKLKAGCQLVRAHEGIDHRVTVVEGGYEWNGRRFASLSSVAKAITGTNWNGHRFFGLKPKSRHVAERMQPSMVGAIS